jgi:hypothetical protein
LPEPITQALTLPPAPPSPPRKQLSPNSASTAGGTNLTLTGRNLGLGYDFAIIFGTFYTYTTAPAYNSTVVRLVAFSGQSDDSFPVTLYACARPVSQDPLRCVAGGGERNSTCDPVD